MLTTSTTLLTARLSAICKETAATLPWSQGPVEGVVNKIKLIKRQVYGRAGFCTLRSMVLFAFEHQS
ncbi:transposase [Deinococcus detaillensis]|uniref:Transposase n=1 Tax=Deinococcus detaillensis TaxID=2592048 RepID=A0A553UMK0_9DEIO|nr:transposase [Deinococcus detaillensis]